jgi:hypothetical protein
MVAPRRNAIRREWQKRQGVGTDQALGEFARCEQSAEHWIDKYCWIEERHDPAEADTGQPIRGETPFHLWPGQRTALRTFRDRRYCVVLKARQLGLSWLKIADSLHRCLFRPSQLVMCYSLGADEAADLVTRAKFLYEHLPDWMRARLPALTRDKAGTLGFANGSILKSRAATKRAGRSFTASEVVADEFAWMQYAQMLYDAAMRAVEAGGRFVIISTAAGAAGPFHDVWQDAYQGTSDFAPVFLPWDARPGRDRAWYEKQVRNATDPTVIPQEYPATPEEAFIASGRTRFQPAWITAQAGNVQDPPVPRESLPPGLANLDLGRAANRLDVWIPPTTNLRIVVGADCAEGLAHGDYDAAIGVDLSSGMEVFTLRGHWEPDEYARLLIRLAVLYDAELVIERNNQGHAVLLAARQLNAGRERKGLRPARLALGHDGRLGWVTSSATKPAMIAAVAARLRDGKLVIRSKATLGELRIYSVLDNGDLGAPAGKHDDLVMALGCACGWAAMRERAGRARAGGSRPTISSDRVRT